MDLLCGLCASGRRPNPGVLGAATTVQYRRVIHVYHEPTARQMRNLTADKLDRLLPSPGDSWSAADRWVGVDDGPDVIDVYCRHHGRLALRRVDVVAVIASSPSAGSMPVQVSERVQA